MKSHPSEGGEIVLEKGHGTNPERERGRNFFPPLIPPLEDSNEESVVLGRLASISLSSFHPPFPSSVFARRRAKTVNHLDERRRFCQYWPRECNLTADF